MKKSILCIVNLTIITALVCVGCMDNGIDAKSSINSGQADKFLGVPLTIAFDADGGTVSPISAKTNKYRKLDSLPTPTKTGYTFSSWHTATTWDIRNGVVIGINGGEKVTENTVFNKDATIYARYTQNTFTVTFDANGGTVSPTSDTISTGATLPTPTRSGYIFEGWYTETTGGTLVTTNTVFSENATIYAQWVGATFIDDRDGNSYKRVRIGDQMWMAENLNYNASGSVCYGNSADSCAKYGRLYNLSTAMNGASSSSLSPSGVQGACPVGWHVPSDDEWSALVDYAGGSSSAGGKLKSTSGWYNNGNGTDEYGFSALPGGLGYSNGGFNNAGYYGSWWGATEYNANYAWYRYMFYNGEGVLRIDDSKAYLFSVRCVMDDN